VQDFTFIGDTDHHGTLTSRPCIEGIPTDAVPIVSMNIRTLTKHKLPVLAWYVCKYAMDCMMLQVFGCTEIKLRYLQNELKHLLGRTR
jgi:hypothetical protein